MNIQEQAGQTVSLMERLSPIRERAAEFLSGIAEKIILGPAEKILDWAEDKPDYVKALGAYAGVPLLAAAEVSAVAVSAGTVGPPPWPYR